MEKIKKKQQKIKKKQQIIEKVQNANIKMDKNENENDVFICDDCSYKTTIKSNYKKHIQTQRHINSIKANENMKNNENYNKNIKDCNRNVGENNTSKNNNIFECICGKSYSYSKNLKRHQKKCNSYKENNNSIVSLDNMRVNDLIHLLLNKKNQNNSSNIQININNNIQNINNNTYILNFLNSKCNDAQILNDFMDTLPLSIDKIKIMNEKGLLPAINNIIVDPLLNMNQIERPIHCINNEKPEFYIKDKDGWTNNETEKKIIDSIKYMTTRLTKFLDKWKELNNDYFIDETKQNFVNESMKKIIEIYDKDIERKILNIMKKLEFDKTI